MAESHESFREFEHAGWGDAKVASKYHEHLSAVTTQSIPALLDAAGITEGSRVLDVATGAGYVAAAAAQRGARVTGIDFSDAQVRMARDRYPAIMFQQADAEALPFEPGTFDAVLNGFGMCHLPNPDAALREAFRVLKPGGRVAFTVWDVPERAVGYGIVYGAVRAHGSLDVGLPVGPNFFLFSDVEHSCAALREAGFVEPSCRRVPQVWCIADADGLFDAILEGTVRASATLRGQGERQRAAIRAASREAVMAYQRGASFELPMPAVVAAAIKP